MCLKHIERKTQLSALGHSKMKITTNEVIEIEFSPFIKT